MNDEENRTSLIMELIRNFGTIFTLSVLAISLAGLLVARFAPDTQDISSLFASGGTGLSYNVILQIAGFSLVLAAFTILLISDRVITKMRFFLRILLLFFSAFVSFSGFAIVFKWFPANDPLLWLGFLLSTVVCFALSLGLTLLKFKLEGKKYDRLLANYKAQRN